MIFFGSRINKLKKYFKLAVVFFVIFLLGAWIWQQDFTPTGELTYGVTFSDKYAKELKLDWQAMYLAMLDDLKVDHLRLSAYWDEIESRPDVYDFTDLDWQMDQAAKRHVKVILAVGRRLPRWPECHDPLWLSGLAPAAIQTHQLEFVRAVVERYQGYDNIITWQVENEPLFDFFGICPKITKASLEEEIALVRSIDNSRLVITTDSGELNHWQAAGSVADELGVTLYRIVWNPMFGFWDYFFVPPAYYHYKALWTKHFHENLSDVVVTELQMEPWTTGKPMIEMTYDEQLQSFDLQRFKNNVVFTKRAGFDEAYLWGVEYWYFAKQSGHPELWNEAKTLWK